MHPRLSHVAGGLLLGGALVVGTAAPVLAAPCDAYSQTCPSPPASTIGGGGVSPAEGSTPSPATVSDRSNPGSTTTTPGQTSNENRTLPFTGGELVLMTALGGAAVAGGTLFVLAGRRRKSVGA